MTELNLSSYIQIMQGRMVTNYTQENTGIFLLSAINNLIDADKYVNIDAKKVSRIVNRIDPVPETFRIASNDKNVISGVIKYFENEVSKDLNTNLIDDLKEDLENLIQSAENVSSGKKKSLLSYKDHMPRFLAEIFIYTLNLPNKRQNEGIDTNDAPLLLEANYECPISHVPLVENIKGQPVKRYAITTIFPDDLPPDKEKAFKAVMKKPKNLSSPENLIALSTKSAEEYLLDPTLDEFKMLVELKSVLSSNYEAIRDVDKVDLEESIRIVLEALMDIDDGDELETLSYDALRIDQKIPDDGLLQKDIQSKVVQFYKYIEKVFSESGADFKQIGSDVQKCAKRFEKKGLSQRDVAYNLAKWMRNKTNLGTDGTLACNAVVAFFIQNCEVFGK